jgi:hypothetical protein
MTILVWNIYEFQHIEMGVIDRMIEAFHSKFPMPKHLAVSECTHRSILVHITNHWSSNTVVGEGRQAEQSTSFQLYVGEVKRYVRAKRRLDLKEEASNLRWREVATRMQESKRERVRE